MISQALSTPNTDQRTPKINLALPIIALVLSFATTAGGSYLTLQINSATTRARMDATDKRVDINTMDIKGMVPEKQFAIALQDLKEEIADMRTDVKEIRRAVSAPR